MTTPSSDANVRPRRARVKRFDSRPRRRYASNVVPESLDERTTIGQFFRQANRLADRTLLRYHDGEGWRGVSWTGMADLVLRVAARLVQEGVRAGDRVVIMAENRLEWLYCDFAIQAAGAVTVPIYPSTPAGTAQAIVDDAGARVAFVDDELAVRLRVGQPVALDA